jgi:predicted nucleotidyltransferase
MYLYGSLASGDFAPQRSDIDLVVVTEDFIRYTLEQRQQCELLLNKS